MRPLGGVSAFRFAGLIVYTGTGVSLARFHGFSRFISYSGVRPTFARHTKKSHKTGLYGQKQ